jgi:hypothetical protein
MPKWRASSAGASSRHVTTSGEGRIRPIAWAFREEESIDGAARRLPIEGPMTNLRSTCLLLALLMSSTTSLANAQDVRAPASSVLPPPPDEGASRLTSPRVPEGPSCDAPCDSPDFTGETGLELALGVGSESSLALGAVLAPEVSLVANVSGVIAEVQGEAIAAAYVGMALDASFVRPRVREVAPVMEVLIGASFPLLVPSGWSARGRAYAALGVGAMYVLDPHLAIRALVSPTLAFDELAAVVGLAGQIVLVARP